MEITPRKVILESLTPREKDVLRLVALGQDNKEMASTLGVEPTTINTHLQNLYQKLHATEYGQRFRIMTRARVMTIIFLEEVFKL